MTNFNHAFSNIIYIISIMASPTKNFLTPSAPPPNPPLQVHYTLYTPISSRLRAYKGQMMGQPKKTVIILISISSILASPTSICLLQCQFRVLRLQSRLLEHQSRLHQFQSRLFQRQPNLETFEKPELTTEMPGLTSEKQGLELVTS